MMADGKKVYEDYIPVLSIDTNKSYTLEAI